MNRWKAAIKALVVRSVTARLTRLKLKLARHNPSRYVESNGWLEHEVQIALL